MHMLNQLCYSTTSPESINESVKAAPYVVCAKLEMECNIFVQNLRCLIVDLVARADDLRVETEFLGFHLVELLPLRDHGSNDLEVSCVFVEACSEKPGLGVEKVGIDLGADLWGKIEEGEKERREV